MHANDFSLRSWKWKFSIYSQRLPCCHDSFNQLWDHVNERTVLCVKRLRLHNFHLSSQFTFTVIVYAITGVITNKVFRTLKKWLMLHVATNYQRNIFHVFVLSQYHGSSFPVFIIWPKWTKQSTNCSKLSKCSQEMAQLITSAVFCRWLVYFAKIFKSVPKNDICYQQRRDSLNSFKNVDW